MTAKSPVTDNIELITSTIKVEGKAIDSAWQVLAIETRHEVNKLPQGKITIRDGSPAESDFEISNTKVFLPGNKIEIMAGYESKEKPIFKGIIVKQAISIERGGKSVLVVTARDKAEKMTLSRKNGYFPKIKDSALITKLIKDNGLKASVASTGVTHEEIIQYYATDWDLMLMRAEANGLIAIVDDGSISVEKPDSSQSPVLKVTYGDSIFDFSAEMDASTQYASKAIQGYSWDYATQKLSKSGAGTVKVTGPGNVKAKELAKVFDVKEFPLQTGGTVQKTSLKDWAGSELQRSMLSRITGMVVFQGSADAKPGKVIELAGVGKRFSGNAFISSVVHRVAKGEWLTEAGFGMSFKGFSEQARDVEAPDASGLLPGIKGLQTGTVKKVAKDPKGEFRVYVNLPLLKDEAKGVWARLGTMYVTNKGGSFFMPEKNDEVIVGFMNEDPRYPVILGSLYSKKIAPPFAPDEENTKKAIYTKGKLQLLFDDKDKIIQIKTPGGHILKMDDKGKEVSIKDSNKNSIVMSKSGIKITSASNLEIKAKANITINAGANLKSSAKANVTTEGLQISNQAKAKFVAKGNASAELTAGAMVKIQGGIVKIN